MNKKIEEGQSQQEISDYMKTASTEILNREGFDYVDSLIQGGSIYL